MMKTVLLAAAVLALPVQQKNDKAGGSPLDHVAVIGASASAGYGIGSSPGGGDVVLAHIVAASLKVKPEEVRNLAALTVFQDMSGYAEKTVGALEKDPPTAIVAIDYLFWCMHGMHGDGEREKLLESALGGLEKFSCPILLGDIPDVTPATKAAMGMITREMLPSAAQRNAANTRIGEWAKKHANVTVVPFGAMVKKVYDGVEIQCRGNRWKGNEVGRLIQGDRLHPTLEGLVGLWIMTADAWLKADKKLAEKSFELKAATLVKAVEPAPSGRSK